jgi:aromatic ring-opening dioxygenase LigB subunit
VTTTEALPLVSAAVLPHGLAAIPGFRERRADFSDVRKGMRNVARMVSSTNPETIVIASPHNMRIEGKMAVVRAENCAGALEEGERALSLSRKCDVELAISIYSAAAGKGLPVVSVNFGTDSGRESKMPLDWGTIVPLWFLPRKARVVLVTPSREIPWGDLVKMGECIGEACHHTAARVSFVASADQAHAHLKSGPYGFDEEADVYDSRVIRIVKEDKLEELLNMNRGLLARAKPDGFWQMLMLHGALRSAPLRLAFCSYACPTYYGMLSAAYL